MKEERKGKDRLEEGGGGGWLGGQKEGPRGEGRRERGSRHRDTNSY